MAILKASNLTKKFGKFMAVDDVSFELKEGEILGFLGKNGAGKTTTIQILLGVLTPTSGDVQYFGKSLSKHREEILEQVNFSSTYTNLPWDLTIKENLTFISYLYKIENRKERISRIVDIFKLGDLMSKQMSELSSGQITRVNLAKAFINFPKVLLLDEPTASLDPDVADEVRQLMLEQKNKFKVSIIWTSHNMSEVEKVCDRVIFVDQGKIFADDTPQNLARTIDICHIELNVADGLKRTIDYCEKSGFLYRLNERNIIVDVKEKNIPTFLKNLMDRGVNYDEISIEKPSLEDYFLKVSTGKL